MRPKGCSAPEHKEGGAQGLTLSMKGCSAHRAPARGSTGLTFSMKGCSTQSTSKGRHRGRLQHEGLQRTRAQGRGSTGADSQREGLQHGHQQGGAQGQTLSMKGCSTPETPARGSTGADSQHEGLQHTRAQGRGNTGMASQQALPSPVPWTTPSCEHTSHHPSPLGPASSTPPVCQLSTQWESGRIGRGGVLTCPKNSMFLGQMAGTRRRQDARRSRRGWRPRSCARGRGPRGVPGQGRRGG